MRCIHVNIEMGKQQELIVMQSKTSVIPFMSVCVHVASYA